MLSLTKDTFVRLAISAQKDSSLNKQFKVVHAETWSKYSSWDLENNPTLMAKQAVKQKSLIMRPNPSSLEKIDDKINNIISNPKLEQIKMELEFAEALLKKIKILDAKNPKIPVIEETISKFKMQLEQKSYV